jgi:hypothetical protein
VLKVPELKKLKWYIACAVMIIVACIAAHIYFGYAKRVDLTPMKKVFAYAEGEEFKPVGKASDKAPGMTPAAENDSLALYIDENTAEIAVVDKKSGAVYFSNPKDRMQDAVANQANKDMLSSQLIIKYFDEAQEGKHYEQLRGQRGEGAVRHQQHRKRRARDIYDGGTDNGRGQTAQVPYAGTASRKSCWANWTRSLPGLSGKQYVESPEKSRFFGTEAECREVQDYPRPVAGGV